MTKPTWREQVLARYPRARMVYREHYGPNRYRVYSGVADRHLCKWTRSERDAWRHAAKYVSAFKPRDLRCPHPVAGVGEPDSHKSDLSQSGTSSDQNAGPLLERSGSVFRAANPQELPGRTPMRKPLAVFTIARNETFWLPRWLAHYGKLDADLFVLDHESSDGSTANIPATVVPVSRTHTDDVGWMLGTVEGAFRGFAESYSRVLFAEADEFLVPDPDFYTDLAEYLEWNAPPQMLTATGYDVCWGPDDPVLDPTRPLLDQRRWKRNDRYDKTLVASQPMSWEVGFHRPTEGKPRPSADPHLLLVHFHYADPELAWARLQGRMNGRVPYPNDWGRQNKHTVREPFDADFAKETQGAEPIPERFRRLL